MFITREKVDEIQKENEILRQKVKELEHQVKKISSHSSGNQPGDNPAEAATLITAKDAFFSLENILNDLSYPNSDTCLEAYNVYIRERFNGKFNDQWSWHINTLKQMLKSQNILSLFDEYITINKRMLNTRDGAALTSLLEQIGVQQEFSLSEQLKEYQEAAKRIEAELSQYGISKQWLIKNKLACIQDKAVGLNGVDSPCIYIRQNGESTTDLINRIVYCSQNFEAALKGYKLSVPQDNQLLYDNIKKFMAALRKNEMLSDGMTPNTLYDAIK